MREPAGSTDPEQSTALNATDAKLHVSPMLTGSADSIRAISDRLEAIQRSIREKATVRVFSLTTRSVLVC